MEKTPECWAAQDEGNWEKAEGARQPQVSCPAAFEAAIPRNHRAAVQRLFATVLPLPVVRLRFRSKRAWAGIGLAFPGSRLHVGPLFLELQ
ncbi:hypothetical protein DB347_18980 [Opitutaceae bacterium EW11]|nr:hypothetical protein DB347_18980 [Opitutaceae bacterium EW11]